MTLTVTNTRTGERETFEPRDPENVLLYYCGLTVSDLPHLGHARSWVHVDVMCRWLEASGYGVRHVENFTDVNEKIVARIGEDDLGDTEEGVARHFVDAVISDMRSLDLERAEVYPRVSEHVPEIIALVERLIETGHAYESNGSVYFDVSSFPAYGELSNQRVEEIVAQDDPDEESGDEESGDDGEGKRHPADFALWKAGPVSPEDANEHRPDDLPPLSEPAGGTWESPWGEGRPGWHVECSAMSMTHLDEHIDVHVGGQDLVFPHHENEIAQSEAATGQRFVDYWLHVAMLETGGEKMSSSLRNFFTVRNAVAEFGADAVRMFLLSTKYDQRQAYTEEALHEAVERSGRLSRAYERAVEAADSPDARTKVEDESLRAAVDSTRDEFRAAMDDDFNTREALRALFALATAVNRHVDGHESYDYGALKRSIETFEGFGGDVLGFQIGDGTGGASDAGGEGGAGRETRLADELIELVLAIREDERDAGSYDRADELRDALAALGVTVEDSDDGTTYRY